MPSEPRRIGVVGASGFIGHALVEDLAADGLHVLRLFGRSGGEVAGLPIEPLELDADPFRGLDSVVHLSGITTSRASWDALYVANIELASRTASAAAQGGVERFVFVSSLHVHGKAAEMALSPDSPFNPDNAYGRSKALAEGEVRKIAADAGMKLVILRPPMVYGPEAKGSFAQLARLVRAGLPLPFALARGRRSFCSIANLVSAIRHSLESPRPAEVLIPADPEDFDAAELTAEMAAALGRKPRIWPAPKAAVASALGLAGRAEMAASLFEPLRVDRSAWASQDWRPVQSGRAAIRQAMTASRPERAQPVILYITNSTPYFFSHRLALAREAARRGYHVAVAGSDVDDHADRLRSEGFSAVHLADVHRGLNPAGDLRAAWALAGRIRTLRPAILHASGLKTMFLCALAGWMASLPRVVCIVTGLGATYINDTPKTRLMRLGIEFILRTLLWRRGATAVFQNGDDRRYFIRRGVTRPNASLVIKGSGVDTALYAASPEPRGRPPRVVFPARLLKAKGVREFAAAARLIHSRGVKAVFALAGDLDPHNPDALTQAELTRLAAEGGLELMGHQSQMELVLRACHIVCLPSYREGLPKALIEAASAGRPIVTTDVPGCREVVTDGENGFVVAARDAEALAAALERLILSPPLRKAMGTAGRRRAEAEFDENVVISQMADLYGCPNRCQHPAR